MARERKKSHSLSNFLAFTLKLSYKIISCIHTHLSTKIISLCIYIYIYILTFIKLYPSH